MRTVLPVAVCCFTWAVCCKGVPWRGSVFSERAAGARCRLFLFLFAFSTYLQGFLSDVLRYLYASVALCPYIDRFLFVWLYGIQQKIGCARVFQLSHFFLLLVLSLFFLESLLLSFRWRPFLY